MSFDIVISIDKKILFCGYEMLKNTINDSIIFEQLSSHVIYDSVQSLSTHSLEPFKTVPHSLYIKPLKTLTLFSHISNSDQ